jgi:sulfate permease, SulP family
MSSGAGLQAEVTLRLARVKPAVNAVLRRDGSLDRLGDDRTHGNVHRAVGAHIEQSGKASSED